MSLQRSMHSSQMNTDGPAISFLTSCWLLPQKEQYKVFSPDEPFFSAMSDLPQLTGVNNDTKAATQSQGTPMRPPGSRRKHQGRLAIT